MVKEKRKKRRAELSEKKSEKREETKEKMREEMRDEMNDTVQQRLRHLRLARSSPDLTGPTVIERSQGFQHPLQGGATFENDHLSIVVDLGPTAGNDIGISRVVISPIEPEGPALAPHELADISWGEVLGLFVDATATPVQVIEEGTKLILRTPMAHPATPDPAAPEAGPDLDAGTGTGQAAEETELRRVAGVYVGAVEGRHRSPVRLVADELHLSLSTAGRRVEAARKAGFIPDDMWAKKRKG